MSYSINIKGKENPKDKQLVKLEMIFFQTGYARVSKVLNITGALKDWDNETQTFKSKSSDAAVRNKQLLDLKMQYLQVVEEWEAGGEPWSPVQWSHALDNAKASRLEAPKVVTVDKWMEDFIETSYKTERCKNGNIVGSFSHANNLKLMKNELDQFTVQKYGKSFSKYYFQDITELFVKDYSTFLQKKGLENGNNAGLCHKLRMLRGICSNANKEGIPGARVSQFLAVKEKLLWDETTPKTLPYEVFRKIENIDRSYFTVKEQFYLDLFLFSFYAGGMGDKDVCYLTWSCIQNDTLVYERMKTCKKAQMPLTDKAKAIIDRYKAQSYGKFVFPVLLEKHATEKQKILRIIAVQAQVNRLLERVRGIVGYKEKITWYSARGTFITKMLEEGYSPLVVAQFAGNSPQVIYKHYFKNTKFEEMRKSINELI